MRGEAGVAFTLLLALVLSGCQYDRHAQEYTATKTTPQPRVQDLAGLYVPTPETGAYVKGQGHYPRARTFILLSPNGTFRFNNVPDWWHVEAGESDGKFDTGNGRWSVAKSQDWWVVDLDFTSTAGFHSEKLPNGLTTDVSLAGDKPPYRLHLPVGDPDAGNAMNFERQKPKD